jgi:cell division protease FtsH
MSHSRDYSEEIASAIDEEVRRLIESAHDEAWEILVQYRDVLDHLVLQLMEHETLSRQAVLEIFAPVHKRPTRGSYTGYGKRLPSEKPPVLTPKEMALIAASDGKELPSSGNGQAPGIPGSPAGGQDFGSFGPAPDFGPGPDFGGPGFGSPREPDDPGSGGSH